MNVTDSVKGGQLSLFPTEMEQMAMDIIDTYGTDTIVDIPRLRKENPRLDLAARIAEQNKFMHWELEFADLFTERGGFDLIIGNPPWIKIEWNEQSVLSDTHPMFAVKKLTATQTTHKRAEALENAVTRKMYFSEYEMLSGEQAFLNAVQNYADLKGQQTNLFKCFLPQSWMYNSKSGVAAFVHPEGVYDDPKGGALREKLYPRLRYHFQFANERKLFPEVDHHTQFSLNVYGGPLMVSFDTISNLYDAKSIVECYEGDAAAPIPGIKDEDGDWNVKGHPDRVIHVTKKELAVFAKLFDGNDNWKQAKLPQLHAKQLIETLECFADSQITVGSLEQKVFTTFYEEEWNRIVIAQEALTLEKYVKATRNGRGTRLDRKKRMQVWKVFENYQNLMKENQIRDINTAMYESTKLLQSAGRKPRYASIIIDEGQDFSDNAYRLIRALAGEEHPNDIFIVGDSHQRIYRNYPTLSKCGINVRGRSSILKINYRTTEEIRKHAFALLNGISFDDLDEDLDLGDKCQSLTHGEKPIVENFENANDEFDFLLREVKKLKENGVSLTDICVVARTKKLVDDYIALFTRAGIRSYAIKRNKVDDRSFDGLRVATMHRVKGLEFKYVFIAAVNNRIIPLPFAINKTDAVSEVESITSEKCLLYVAMTRAQKGVYITSYGRPSEFLV